MAFGSWVQGTSKDAGSITSTTLAYGSNVTAGNTLLIAIRGGSSGYTITVSDNLNGSWTSDDGPFAVTSAGTMQHFRFSGTAAGACTVTVNFSSSNTCRFIIDEYTGKFSLDGALHAQGSGTGTALDSGPLTTTHTCAIIGWGVTGNTATTAGSWTPGSGFTTRENLTTASHNETVVVTEDMSTTQAAGTYDATGTIGPADFWGMGVLGYYQAAAFLPETATVAGQGSTPGGMSGASNAPTVTQAVRRGGYY